MRKENDEEPGLIKRFLQKELEQEPGSKMTILGKMEAVYWTDEIEQDGDALFIYNWTTGEKGTLLICSFVLDKDRIDQKEVKKELEHAIYALESISVRLEVTPRNNAYHAGRKFDD